MRYLIITINLFIISLGISAGTKYDKQAPINHCYHWLNENSNQYLSFKYTYAKTNGNELTFFTSPSTSNGSVAGPGLYCGKSPADSYSYGDRVVRVDFVPDVVLHDQINGIQYCGFDGETSRTSKACANKKWDVQLFSSGGTNGYAWYVIQNPAAVQTWSANSDQVINDLNINLPLSDSNFNSHAKNALSSIDRERKIMGEQVFFNQKARFSIVDLILQRPAEVDSIPPLKVIEQVLASNTNRLTNDEKIELYKRYSRKALASKVTKFSEIEPLLQKSDELERIFQEAVSQEGGEQNPVILLGFISKYPKHFNQISQHDLSTLLERIFKDPKNLIQLSETSIRLEGRAKVMALQYLEDVLKQENSTQNATTVTLPSILENVSTGAELNKLKRKWESVLFTNKKQNFGIKVGNKNFYLRNENVELKNQCHTAINLAANEKSPVVALLHRDQEYILGEPTDLNICQNFSNIVLLLNKVKLTGPDKDIHTVSGKMKTIPYVFIGDTVEVISEQCKEFYLTIPKDLVLDEILISLVGMSGINRSNYHGWKTAVEVCDQITTHANTVIPTIQEKDFAEKREALKIKNLAQKNKLSPGFQVEAKTEKYNFTLYADNRDDLQTQCLEVYPYLPNNNQIYRTEWAVNSSNSGYAYLGSGSRTAATYCQTLIETFANIVPSKVEITNTIKRDSLKAKYLALKNSSLGYLVEGSISNMNNSDFTLYANNRDDLKAQCLEVYPYLPNRENIGYINWKVNSSNTGNAHYGGYYKQAADICRILIDSFINVIPSKEEIDFKLKRDALKSKYLSLKTSSSGFVVEALLNSNNSDFTLYAHNRDDLYTQCLETYPYLLNKNNINYIHWKVNSSNSGYAHYGGNSRTAAELCQTFVNSLNNLIPSKEEIEFKNKRDLLKTKYLTFKTSLTGYKLEGNMDNISNTDFTLYADNRDDLHTQCLEVYPYFSHKDRTNQIYWKVNSTNTGSTYYGGHLRSAADVCRRLIDSLSKIVPSNEEIDFKNKRDSLKAKYLALKTSSTVYTLEGNIDNIINTDFTLHAENRDELQAQCLEVYPYLPNKDRAIQIFWKVNSSKTGATYFGGDFKSDAEFCKKLIESISKSVPSIEDIDFKNKRDLLKARYLALNTASKTYRLEGEVDDIILSNFTLYADNRDDLRSQCLEVYPYLPNKNRTNQIRWQINSSNGGYTYYGGSYRKAAEVCDQMMNSLYAIPTKIELKNQMAINSLNKKWSELKKSSPNGSMVTGRFNDIPFAFYGHNRDEILGQCHEFHKYIEKGTIFQNLYIMFNTPNEVRYQSPYPYWQTASDVCGKIESVISSIPSLEEINSEGPRKLFIQKIQALETNSSLKGQKLTGNIGGYPYYFYGFSLEDITKQCSEFYQYLPHKNKVNNISYSVNGSTQKELKTAGAWSNESQVCGQLVSAVKSLILSKKDQLSVKVYQDKMNQLKNAIENEAHNFSQTDSSYKLNGLIGNYKFYFYGNNHEEIMAQCSQYKKFLPGDEAINDIELKLNNSSAQKLIYAHSSMKLCDWLDTYLAVKVPTLAEIEAQYDDDSFSRKFQTSTASYKGIMKLQDRYFYIYTQKLKNVKKQCMEQYSGLKLKEGPSRVVYSINNNGIKEANLGTTYSDKRKFCKDLMNILKSEK